MKKNTALQIIALALAFILIAGVIVGVIFWQNGNISFTPFGQEQTGTPDEETPNEEVPVSPIETTISNNEHISLARSAAVTAADTNTVSVELTAPTVAMLQRLHSIRGLRAVALPLRQLLVSVSFRQLAFSFMTAHLNHSVLK